MVVHGTTLPAYTPEQKEAAESALARVDDIANAVGANVVNLERNFVSLGAALYEVYRDQHWMVAGHGSFGKYLRSLEPRAKRGRTQLYHCLGVVQDLLPHTTEHDLVEIGITKAILLRKALTSGADVGELVEDAKTKTKDELEDLVGETTGDDEGPGRWVSFGGARYTEDELEEFIRAVNITLRTDPPIQVGGGAIKKWSEVPPQAKKEVLFRWLAGYVVEAENALREESLSVSGLN